MLLVMVAIGGTDILFALDSIPAIFGLTQNVYLVFTATAFSLLGLRQLYFLLDGLLDRLIYLSYGLAAILGFIGVKLILHALHENNVPFINDGEPVEVVEISTGLSLAVIIGVLVVTVVASLISPKGRAQNLVAAARRHATEFLDIETDPAVLRGDLPQAASRGGPLTPAAGEVPGPDPRGGEAHGAATEGPRRARSQRGELTHAPSAGRTGRAEPTEDQLAAWVSWYNQRRLHGARGGRPPNPIHGGSGWPETAVPCCSDALNFAVRGIL